MNEDHSNRSSLLQQKTNLTDQHHRLRGFASTTGGVCILTFAPEPGGRGSEGAAVQSQGVVEPGVIDFFLPSRLVMDKSTVLLFAKLLIGSRKEYQLVPGEIDPVRGSEDLVCAGNQLEKSKDFEQCEPGNVPLALEGLLNFVQKLRVPA